MRNFFSGHRVPTFLLFVLWLALPAFLSAQISATLFDINPNSSSLDPSDPDGASGGRVNGLGCARNGSAYYAASEWGGIYKSTDTGRNWFRLNNHLPTVTWDVEVDPSNANRVYATSFYDGRVNSLAGINVSNDAGNTWTHPPTAVSPAPPYTSLTRSREPSAFGIAIDPANTNNVYIGTNTGLAISNNGGVTWRYVDPTPGDIADNVWDVVVHHGGIIDIVGDDGHARSTDGGNTWTVLGTLPSGQGSIAASPDESYVLFAVVGTSIFQTTNAGATWTGLTNPDPYNQNRASFVATNKRSGQNYDLWFGDVKLWRTSCTTPSPAAFGGAGRAPVNSWAGDFTRSAGGHDDCGDILFNPTVSPNACPLLFSSDGGVYFNTRTGADCQSPFWEQPTTTPHGLWPFAMSGTPRAGQLPEDLYFGNQDNGSFGSTNAGTNNPTWTNRDCCDGFDFISDPSRALYTICCRGTGRANRMYMRAPGLGAGGEINAYPPGNLAGFRFPDLIDQFGPDDYAMVTTNGLFITNDITTSPIVWSAQMGASTSPAGLCEVKASRNAGTPVFYCQSGGCSGDAQNRLWRFTGTSPAGTWQQITPRGGVGGFGVYDVDPNNSNRIFASHLRAGQPAQMILSEDGGNTWRTLPALDNLMTGNGTFRAQTLAGPSNFTGFGGYFQPSFVAFDPDEPRILVAGAIDAGVFVSNDNGVCWTLVTDPFNSGASGVPHIPRPKFAYFSHQPDAGGKKVVHVYVGSQGRGVWRIELKIDGFTTTSIAGTPNPPNCPGGCDGSISVTPAGGSAPYTFKWSNGQTTQNATGLCAGTYTVTVSDKFGCVQRSFNVPDGVDVTPPVIACPINVSVSCELSHDPPATGTAAATDICGIASIVHSDLTTPGSCPQEFTIKRTWKATDNNGLTATCVQTVEVFDKTPPALNLPPNITVTCDTSTAKTGVATAPDNCDPSATITYSDQVTGGFCEWVCDIDRTWKAVDDCRNVSQGVQKIQKNVLPLIQQALTPGPIVLGVTQTTLTITLADAPCILGWVPSSGTAPVGMKHGQQVVGPSCKPGNQPVDGAGRLTNPLLVEVLKLSLLARLSDDFAKKKLSTFPCTIKPIVLNALAPNPDITELLRVANIAIGNIALAPHLQELYEALQCINGTTDLCKVTGQ